jgi:hypothetical protein
MRALQPAQLLEARDRCAGLHPLDRALMLLRIAAPDLESDPAHWPIAQRDRALFDLRRAMFGDRMQCVVDCPACGDTQEFALSAGDLRAAIGDPPEQEKFEWAGGQVTLRPLDSRDLAAAAHAATPDAAARLLCGRAIADTHDFHGPLPDAIAARIETREAAADIALELACALCGHRWTEGFDIDAQLGREVESSAHQLLHELAALASRFGWSERDMLAMTAARRRAYLGIAV